MDVVCCVCSLDVSLAPDSDWSSVTSHLPAGDRLRFVTRPFFFFAMTRAGLLALPVEGELVCPRPPPGAKPVFLNASVIAETGDG